MVPRSLLLSKSLFRARRSFQWRQMSAEFGRDSFDTGRTDFRMVQEVPEELVDKEWLSLAVVEFPKNRGLHSKLNVISGQHLTETLLKELKDCTFAERKAFFKVMLESSFRMTSNGIDEYIIEFTISNLLIPFKTLRPLRDEADLLPALIETLKEGDFLKKILFTRNRMMNSMLTVAPQELYDMMASTILDEYHNDPNFLKNFEDIWDFPYIYSRVAKNASPDYQDKLLQILADNEEFLFSKERRTRSLLSKLLVAFDSVELKPAEVLKIEERVLECRDWVSHLVLVNVIRMKDTNLFTKAKARMLENFDSRMKEYPSDSKLAAYYELIQSIDNVNDLESVFDTVIEELNKTVVEQPRLRTLYALQRVIGNPNFTMLPESKFNALIQSLEDNAVAFVNSTQCREALAKLLLDVPVSKEIDFLVALQKGFLKAARENREVHPIPLHCLGAMQQHTLTCSKGRFEHILLTKTFRNMLENTDVMFDRDNRVAIQIMKDLLSFDQLNKIDFLSTLSFLGKNPDVCIQIIDRYEKTGSLMLRTLLTPSEKVLEKEVDEELFFSSAKAVFSALIADLREDGSETKMHLVSDLFRKVLARFPREKTDEYDQLFTEESVQSSEPMNRLFFILLENCSEDKQEELSSRFGDITRL